MALIRQEKPDLFRAKPGIDKPLEGTKCPICRNEFTDTDYMRQHVKRKHPNYS